MRRDRRAPARSRSSTVQENSNQDGNGSNRRAAQHAARSGRRLLAESVAEFHIAMIAQGGHRVVGAADRMGTSGASHHQIQMKFFSSEPTRSVR